MGAEEEGREGKKERGYILPEELDYTEFSNLTAK